MDLLEISGGADLVDLPPPTETDEEINISRLSLTDATEVVLDPNELAESYENFAENSLPSSWKGAKKHVFILSEAGKPIYSRNGEEDALVTLFAVMQAIVSVVEDEGDSVQSLKAGHCLIVFRKYGPLICVAVTKQGESEEQLALHLQYVYQQIVTVLTSVHLEKILSERRNYDLRRLISGSERLISSLLNYVENDLSVLVGSVRYLKLPYPERDTVASAISICVKVKNVVFALIVADSKIVSLVRMKKYGLQPSDLHLLLNLISSTGSFKTAESWTPICLPNFDPSGFLHMYVSYLRDDSSACLVLITNDRDSFYSLSESKTKLVEKLQKSNLIDSIEKNILEQTSHLRAVDSPDLRHFVYKSRSLSQCVISEFGLPYRTTDERQKVIENYRRVYHLVSTASRPQKLVLETRSHEVTVGWVTQGFELLATFEPLATKGQIVNSINSIIKWVKKDEDSIFASQSPTF